MFKASSALLLFFGVAAALTDTASASLGQGKAQRENQLRERPTMDLDGTKYLYALHPLRRERESRKKLRNLELNNHSPGGTARRLPKDAAPKESKAPKNAKDNRPS
mmetsp:Transcript_22759/g.67284  ORF Transcript_22759/g.67284 Transcript_22759/m.67284 type:complete len:106 (+) Transcript_22759:685-1002(+)